MHHKICIKGNFTNNRISLDKYKTVILIYINAVWCISLNPIKVYKQGVTYEEEEGKSILWEGRLLIVPPISRTILM
jgi:hypothetical protein